MKISSRQVGPFRLFELIKLLPLAILAILPLSLQAADSWLVEMRSFEAVQLRQAAIGKTVGNAMLPMMIVSFAQQRIAKMYGGMRSAEPVRWAGYPDGKGNVDVVMVYPSVDKIARMLMNHAGSEKVSSDTVLLPADEGREIPTYAVFSSDSSLCAFGRTPELCRKALGEKFPPAGEDLIAVSAGGASGAFDFDDKGFKFMSRTVTPETAAKLKDVPFLGILSQGGVTRYVTFEDVKNLVASLVKELAVAKGLSKGNE